MPEYEVTFTATIPVIVTTTVEADSPDEVEAVIRKRWEDEFADEAHRQARETYTNGGATAEFEGVESTD